MLAKYVDPLIKLNGFKTSFDTCNGKNRNILNCGFVIKILSMGLHPRASRL